MTTNRKTVNDQIAEVEAAWAARQTEYFNPKSRAFRDVTLAYRARKIDDAAYLAARKADAAVNAEFDKEIAEVTARLEALEAMADDDAEFDRQVGFNF